MRGLGVLQSLECRFRDLEVSVMGCRIELDIVEEDFQCLGVSEASFFLVIFEFIFDVKVFF